MRFWAKKPEEEPSRSSIACAAVSGASREELLEEALKELTQDHLADRVGVWLEPGPHASSANEFSGAFHGLVWDRGSQDDCPAEWKFLSLEPPLPAELLLGAEPFEQNLEDSASAPLIGQLVGLRRALWVPIASQGRVKGMILLGSAGESLASSLAGTRAVAAELALAVDAEDQLRDARISNVELTLVRHFLETPMDSSSIQTLLSELVANSVEPSHNGDSLAAVFAAIGELPSPDGNTSFSPTPDFRWRRGDDVWTSAIETNPLAKLWRSSLKTRHILGSEPPATWPQAAVARIVAVPLEAEGELLGALVAGLSGRGTSLATLSRLQLRARLAAFALQRKRQLDQDAQRTSFEQSLLDSVRDPMLLLDDAGRISASSRGARELFSRAGLPAGLLSGQLSDHCSGADRERLQKWLRRALDAPTLVPSGEAPRAELRNGFAVRLRLTPLVPGRTAVALDLEDALEPHPAGSYGEAELLNVIEWLEEGVVLYDARENVRAMNMRFKQIVGLTPEESANIKTLDELIGRLQGQAAEPAWFAERWRELARTSSGGVREQLNMVRPSPRVLDRAARPILDGAGRQVGRVEIYRDLTAQRAFHSQLLQTEKLAALGQMVSGIAHELSNPLTSIIGYSQRLLRTDATGRSEEIRQIYQEAERAGSILRQLLMNARETIPERRPVSLNQVVSRALELQRFSLAAGKIAVELDLDPALPFVYGDAGQLQQVLMNLMGNARHALEEQNKKRTIHLRTRRPGERRVLLEVEDNGPGIPQAIQARIFDPFFTTKPAGVGTGLGLAIVLGVVREHGGQVRLQTPPQGGALFQIELPAASERQQEEAQSPRSHEPRSTLTETATFPGLLDSRSASFEAEKKARVLVVEDEPTVAQLIADVLQDEGMRVDVILDGREALDRAARESYDLVICDMKMPSLGGQRFYRALQRNGNPLRERFLFVTGDVMAAQTREFLERNRLPHVAKPFRVEELTEKVHAVLRAQEQREPAPAEVSRKNAARNG